MQVHFGEVDAIKSGITSMVYWESPNVEFAMNLLFRTRPSEKIDCIIINKDGIKARFIREASPLVKDFVNKHGEELMKDLPGRKDMVDYADLVHDGLKSVEQKIAKKAGEILANKIG